MLISVEFDSTNQEDAAALARLFGSTAPATVVQHTPPPAKVERPKAQPKPVPAPEPKPTPAPEPKPTPAPEPSSDVDLREQAVQKATDLVTSGKSAIVREALAELGAKRVSDLQDGEQLASFLLAVSE